MKKINNLGGIIGYPRSGNNWMSYCIKNIFKVPSNYAHGNGENVWHEILRGNNTYVFIFRNYKECIPRHGGNDMRKIMSQLTGRTPLDKEYETNRTDYVALLKLYDMYDKNKKFFVYYEDLILNPKRELLKFLPFFGLGYKSNLDFFFDRIDYHKNESLRLYGKNIAKPHTMGDPNKLNYHSEKLLVKDQRKTIDQHIETKFPELFNKYLIRYKEK